MEKTKNGKYVKASPKKKKIRQSYKLIISKRFPVEVKAQDQT